MLYEHPREDRENVRNKSCVSRSWTLQNDTTHGQTGSTTSQQTAGRAISAWQLDGKVAGHARHPRFVTDILAMMSRGCYAENGPVEFKLQPALSTDATPAIPSTQVLIARQKYRVYLYTVRRFDAAKIRVGMSGSRAVGRKGTALQCRHL